MIIADKDLLPFLADRVADVDALVTYVVDTVRTSETFDDFKTRLLKNLGEIKISSAVDVNAWLADQKEGFVVISKPEYGEYGPVDYLRDDDNALPTIFATRYDALQAIPTDHEMIRIIDLQEDYEKRQNS